MAQYRGTISGQRGEASRLGSKRSGINVKAASWSGAVTISLWYDEKNGVDVAEVRLTTHHGHGTDRLLYSGPVSGCPMPVVAERSAA